jgi:hypothetical protein
MSDVPIKILVGPTTYIHFRRKHKDFYVPDFLAPDGVPAAAAVNESPHVWRYTVSPDYHNTVFFYNATTKKSVWVLPIVHPDGHTEELGDGEVMHAIRGPSPSSSPAQPSERPSSEREEQQQRTPSAITATAETSDERKAEKIEHRRDVISESGRRSTKDEKAQRLADASNAASPWPTSSSPVRTTPSQGAKSSTEGNVVAEETQPTLFIPTPSPLPSSASASNNAVSRTRVEAALQRAQQASPLTISIGGATTHNQTPSTSLQQRLAAWRAKRHQLSIEIPQEAAAEWSTPQSSAPAPTSSTSAAGAASSRPVVSDPLRVISAAVVHSPESTTTAPTTGGGAESGVVHRASPSSTTPKQAASALATPPKASLPASPIHNSPTLTSHDGDVRRASTGRASPVSSTSGKAERLSAPSLAVKQLDAVAKARAAQEAELARVAALLRQEKIDAMEQERAALECRRRALFVEQQEAADRTRMMEARAAAEKARTEMQERLRREQQRQQQLLDERAAADARTREVNEYVVVHQRMESEAEATVADSFSYAARIAAQLAAAAPHPGEFKSTLLKNEEGGRVKSTAPPTPVGDLKFREHHVGRSEASTAPRGSPFRSMQLNLPNNTAPAPKGEENTPTKTITEQPAQPAQPTRTVQRICYGIPFVYEGEVVNYKPARAFFSGPHHPTSSANTQSQAETLRHKAAVPPDPPPLLCARRDGTGTQYYDADSRYFFAGEWRDDQREGPGVLSLPSSAVQGHWHKDQLSGSAVLQTKRAKSNAIFTSASTTARHAPFSYASSALTTAKPSDSATTASPDLPSHHVSLNGNAVVELHNGSLFVGALRDSRVGAPYVLQLGEGDYIEWLGPPTSRSTTAEESPQKPHGGPPSGASQSKKAISSSSLFSASARRENPAGSGEGRIRFRNGDTYVGHVRDFQLHGMGYYRVAADGQSYTGVFQHGLPHGDGLMIFANGDLYKGQFVKGLFHGVGSYSSKAGGYVYEGGWVDGVMAGEGTLSYANGDVWRGVFRDNARVSGAYTAVA